MIKIFRFLLVRFTFCLIGGILMFTYLNSPLWILLAIQIATISLLSIFYKTQRFKLGFEISSYIFFFVLGGTLLYLHNPLNQSNHYTYSQQNSNWSKVQIVRELKPIQGFYRYVGEVKQIGSVATQGKVFVNIPDSISEVNLGDDLIVSSNFRALSPAKIPGQFDFKRFANRKGIYQQLWIGDPDALIRTGSENYLKNTIEENLDKSKMSKEVLGLIKALVLGDKNTIEKGVYKDYANAGVIHILAISGLHIGLIYWFLMFLLKHVLYQNKYQWIRLTVVLLVLISFAIFTGGSPSVVRSVLMFGLIGIAQVINRGQLTLHTLFVSMFLLLLFNPNYLFDVGFQMSYLAVFFIVWLTPHIEKIITVKGKVFRYFWKLISVSLAAQIGVLPLSIYYFHQVPTFFLIGNICILPILPFLLIGSFVFVAISCFTVPPIWFVRILEFLFTKVNGLIHFLASSKYALIGELSIDFKTLALCYILLIIIVLFLERKKFYYLILFTSLIISFQVSELLQSHHESSKQELILVDKGFLFRDSNRLEVYSYDLNKLDRLVDTYKLNNRIDSIHYSDQIPEYFKFKGKTFWIPELTNQKVPRIDIDYLIITNNQQFNLGRLLKEVKLKCILVDNTIYKIDKALYQKTVSNTCEFYDIKSSGFLILN